MKFLIKLKLLFQIATVSGMSSTMKTKQLFSPIEYVIISQLYSDLKHFLKSLTNSLKRHLSWAEKCTLELHIKWYRRNLFGICSGKKYHSSRLILWILLVKEVIFGLWPMTFLETWIEND